MKKLFVILYMATLAFSSFCPPQSAMAMGMTPPVSMSFVVPLSMERPMGQPLAAGCSGRHCLAMNHSVDRDVLAQVFSPDVKEAHAVLLSSFTNALFDGSLSPSALVTEGGPHRSLVLSSVILRL